MEQQQDEERSSVGATARRLLKDSGRYLIAGVKAALAGPATPADVVLDAWRQGHRDLRLARTNMSALVTGCLARHTSGCAEKGIDLLLEQAERLPQAIVDAGRVDAVLDKVLEVARGSCAQNRALRVRVSADTTGGRLVVSVQGDLDGAPPSEADDSPLGLSRDILAAHGGELRVERTGYGEADTHVGFTVVLPAADIGPS